MKGRVAVVTGASRGLGRAIALELGRRGVRVGVGYRVQEDEARATVEAVGDAFLVPVDVSRPSEVQRAFAAVAREQGPIDILVNNASVVAETLFALSNADEWREVIEVDLLGAAACCRAVARPMMARRTGAIVNVASTSALRALPGQSAYAAAKAGALAMTWSLAAELAPHGIRVNAVVPGLLDTGMGQRIGQRARDALVAKIPLGRAGAAEEVARAVAFLCSDDASYVVGASLVVDGGLTL